MLSRKYYKMIAKSINEQGNDDSVYINKDDLIDTLCIEFKADNYAFNRDRFVDACDERRCKYCDE